MLRIVTLFYFRRMKQGSIWGRVATVVFAPAGFAVFTFLDMDHGPTAKRSPRQDRTRRFRCRVVAQGGSGKFESAIVCPRPGSAMLEWGLPYGKPPPNQPVDSFAALPGCRC